MASWKNKTYQFCKTILKDSGLGTHFRQSPQVLYFNGFKPSIKTESVSYQLDNKVSQGLGKAAKLISSTTGIDVKASSGYVVSGIFNIVDHIESTYQLYTTKMPSICNDRLHCPTKQEAIEKVQEVFGGNSVFRDFVSELEVDSTIAEKGVEEQIYQRFAKYRRSKALLSWASLFSELLFKLVCMISELLVSRLIVASSVLILNLGYIAIVAKLAKSVDLKAPMVTRLQKIQANLRYRRQRMFLLSDKVNAMVEDEKLLRQTRWLIEFGREATSEMATDAQKIAFLDKARNAPKYMVFVWIQEIANAYYDPKSSKADKQAALARLSCIEDMDQLANGVIERVQKNHSISKIVTSAIWEFLKDHFGVVFKPGEVIIATLLFYSLSAFGLSLPVFAIAFVVLITAAKPLTKMINQAFRELFFRIYMSKLLRPLRKALPVLDKILGVHVVNKYDCHPNSDQNYQKSKHILQACVLANGKGFKEDYKLKQDQFVGPRKPAVNILSSAAAAA